MLNLLQYFADKHFTNILLDWAQEVVNKTNVQFSVIIFHKISEQWLIIKSFTYVLWMLLRIFH